MKSLREWNSIFYIVTNCHDGKYRGAIRSNRMVCVCIGKTLNLLANRMLFRLSFKFRCSCRPRNLLTSVLREENLLLTPCLTLGKDRSFIFQTFFFLFRFDSFPSIKCIRILLTRAVVQRYKIWSLEKFGIDSVRPRYITHEVYWSERIRNNSNLSRRYFIIRAMRAAY